MIRVLLADDQALLRAAFKVLLASDSEMEVVGDAADGEEAVRQVRLLRPDPCSWTSACRTSMVWKQRG